MVHGSWLSLVWRLGFAQGLDHMNLMAHGHLMIFNKIQIEV